MASVLFSHALVLVRGGGDLASGAIYRLHRGTADSVYILSTTLSILDPIRIESAGAGVLPTMFIATLSDGSPISPMIT